MLPNVVAASNYAFEQAAKVIFGSKANPIARAANVGVASDGDDEDNQLEKVSVTFLVFYIHFKLPCVLQ